MLGPACPQRFRRVALAAPDLPLLRPRRPCIATDSQQTHHPWATKAHQRRGVALVVADLALLLPRRLLLAPALLAHHAPPLQMLQPGIMIVLGICWGPM